jgi:hypothetical protein
MEFRELVNEELEPNDFAQKIKDVMSKNFPKSYAETMYSTNLGKSIYGKFTLGSGKEEWPNGISNNDPLIHTFHVFFNGNDKYELRWSQGNMTVKPESPHMAYGRVKTGLRDKKSATQDQVLKSIDDFFKKLKTIVKDNKDKIHPNHVELFKKKNLI